MAAEYWAHHYFEHPEDQESVDDDFDVNAEIAAANEGEDLPDDFEDVK